MVPTDWTGSRARATPQTLGTQTGMQREEEFVVASIAKTGFK